MSREKILTANISDKERGEILEKFDFVLRVCALRFCDDTNFEDFVQEGIVSILEKSLLDYGKSDNFVQVIITNCLEYQNKYYNNNYKERYSVFDKQNLIKEFGLDYSLFGKEDGNFYECGTSLSQDETVDFVKSIINSKKGKLKKVLQLLYDME